MVETYKHAQSRPLSTFAKIVVYVYDELIISYCRMALEGMKLTSEQL